MMTNTDVTTEANHETNPYQSGAEHIDSRGAFPQAKNRPWLGAVVGMVSDLLSSIVMWIALFAVMGWVMYTSGVDSSFEEAFDAMLQQPLWRSLFLLACGLGSLLGGYLCARLAGAGLLKAMLIMVALTVFSDLALSLLDDGASATELDDILSWLASLFGMCLGWWLGHRSNRRRFGPDYLRVQSAD